MFFLFFRFLTFTDFEKLLVPQLYQSRKAACDFFLPKKAPYTVFPDFLGLIQENQLSVNVSRYCARVAADFLIAASILLQLSSGVFTV